MLLAALCGPSPAPCRAQSTEGPSATAGQAESGPAKPIDRKTIDAKPIDTRPVDGKTVDGKTIEAKPAGDAASRRVQIVRNVEYARHGEQALLSDLYVPPGAGPFPAVLVVHGGYWSIGSKSQLGYVARDLAEHGLSAMAINYRLAPTHKFPAQLDDCEQALLWMVRNAARLKADPARLAAYGYSAGGHLATLLAARRLQAALAPQPGTAADAGRLRAVVAGGCPCDFRQIEPDNRALAFFLGATRGENPAVYDQASPAHFVSREMPPHLFFHGEDDQIVDPKQPEAMADRLAELGAPCEFYLVHDKGHVMAMFDAQAIDKSIRFLQEKLETPRQQPPQKPQPQQQQQKPQQQPQAAVEPPNNARPQVSPPVSPRQP